MRSLVTLCILILPVPLAAAACLEAACVEDDAYGASSCDEPGDFGEGSTRVTLAEAVAVEGSWWCYHDPGSGADFGGTEVAATALGASLAWSGDEHGCEIKLSPGEGGEALPCPAAPPNPGWARLLP